MNQPQIWHYGLVAQYWAEHKTDPGPELAFYESLIHRSGQPALDLGCGSGRLLLPLLQAGIDIDGCDISGDMIAVCREEADKQGHNPDLYVQPLHALDLRRKYQTIFATGTVGLGGKHRLTLKGFERCFEHLLPDGIFAFDYVARWNDPPAWSSRLPENRGFGDWWGSEDRIPMSDGTELVMHSRVLGTDPLENVVDRQIRVQQWQGEEMIAEEVHNQKLDDYSKNELVLMLERAGFANIRIFGDFSDKPATAVHDNLVFVAKK